MHGLASLLDPILNNPNVESAVVLFDSTVKLAEDFTIDTDAIEKQLSKLSTGDNGAAILDAAMYGLKLLNQRPRERQRVLLLISETRDHGSHFAKTDGVIKLTGFSNTAVYALPFSPSLSNVLDTERGTNRDEMGATPDLLAVLAIARQSVKKNVPKAIASMTGGEYELFATRKSFETDITKFTNHLHSRYLLSFQPKDPHPGLHRIQVRLRNDWPGQTVVFRTNYWAGR